MTLVTGQSIERIIFDFYNDVNVIYKARNSNQTLNFIQQILL